MVIAMPKRSSKRDVNQIAKSIIDQISGDTTPPIPGSPQKNPAAVALGRLGGLKGGKARAEKLSKSARKAIARRAANARWRKKPHS
jgi:hypothetical protein